MNKEIKVHTVKYIFTEKVNAYDFISVLCSLDFHNVPFLIIPLRRRLLVEAYYKNKDHELCVGLNSKHESKNPFRSPKFYCGFFAIFGRGPKKRRPTNVKGPNSYYTSVTTRKITK